MSDTSNTTVTGIQNIPVSSITPSDGYTLTYIALTNEWIPAPKAGTNKIYFTADGYWTAPSDVSMILISASGGGSGGGGGGRNTFGGVDSPTIGQGGGGGGAAIQSQAFVSVIPENTYTINIGAGGIGGAGAQDFESFDFGVNGMNGNSTLFKDAYDSVLFSALGGGLGLGGGCLSDTRVPGTGGANFPSTPPSTDRLDNPLFSAYGGACDSTGTALDGQINTIGNFSPGAAGSASGAFSGGGGGGAGPQGNGGNGGNGDSMDPTDGSSASANTGAAGGGGGGGGELHGDHEAGSGGDGGSGYLYIIW